MDLYLAKRRDAAKNIEKASTKRIPKLAKKTQYKLLTSRRQSQAKVNRYLKILNGCLKNGKVFA